MGNAQKKIVVIEDEQDILELVSYNLEKEGFSVAGALSGEAGVGAVKRENPDLVVLDLMLPGIDGLQVCRQLKESPETKDIPVIMMSARGEESEIVNGLEYGAEDYVTKPFSPKVLVARVKAVLRRVTASPVSESEIINIENLSIDPGRHRVISGGEEISLTATEFKILHYLAMHPGWVFTRYQIVDAIRGENHAVTDRAVDVQVVALRKKLGQSADLIETVRGVGYRFRE